MAREGVARRLAAHGDEQVVDEDNWSGGRGRLHLRSGGHGDLELLARAQARRDLDLDRLPIGGRELDHGPGRSTLWHLDRHHGARGRHDLCHGSLDSSRSGAVSTNGVLLGLAHNVMGILSESWGSSP